uniref:En-A2 pheromone n=1 Tax=Euplotes nobilii TaxID=184062 RepID=C4NXD6_EUPNO|nr:En-A2 pheromone precursor [Euplotes nobilii]
MTKLSIFVVIAMLVMVSSAFRFQSRMKAKTETQTPDYLGQPPCQYAEEDAVQACTETSGTCGVGCCTLCYIGSELQVCLATASANEHCTQ